jgi:hypothetical protein
MQKKLLNNLGMWVQWLRRLTSLRASPFNACGVSMGYARLYGYAVSEFEWLTPFDVFELTGLKANNLTALQSCRQVDWSSVGQVFCKTFSLLFFMPFCPIVNRK